MLNGFDQRSSVPPKYRDRGSPSGRPLVDQKLLAAFERPNAGPSEFGFIFHAKRFNLFDEKEMKEYGEIRDKIINRAYMQLDRQKIFAEDGSTMCIYLEWAEILDYGPTKSRIPHAR
jgi:hypothetical protein